MVTIDYEKLTYNEKRPTGGFRVDTNAACRFLLFDASDRARCKNVACTFFVLKLTESPNIQQRKYDT